MMYDLVIGSEFTQPSFIRMVDYSECQIPYMGQFRLLLSI